jgi:hypothetical protein
MSETDTERTEERAPSIRITVIIQHRYTLDTELVTGRQIKEMAGIPPGFALFRRGNEGKEPVGDDVEIRARNGDHFFAQPGGQRQVGHREAGE